MAEAHTRARAGHVTVSAGYVKLTTEGVVCYDESVSLALKPRPQDAALIERALGMKSPLRGATEVRDGDWHPTAPFKRDILGLNRLP
jgi:hypothetical protein